MNPGTAAGRLEPSAGLLALFIFFALATVAGALATITRRNPVVAVVCLVGTFFALAVEFLLLSASFLAVIQVLVYAGAIMVLFVFVVMVINRSETEPLWRVSSPLTKAAATLGVLALAYRVITLLGATARMPASEPPPGFGSVEGVGRELLGDFAFPFEAISILLLIAVVGALVIARQHHDKPALEEMGNEALPSEGPAARPSHPEAERTHA